MYCRPASPPTRFSTLVLLSAAMSIGGVCLRGQTPPQPVLEVATIKPHAETPGVVMAYSTVGSRFNMEGARLTDLVLFAYNLQAFQLSGTPAWNNARYDVVLKAEGETRLTTNQARTLLQSVLAERFRLKVHRETKEMPEYRMVAAKNGPKLKESTPDGPLLLGTTTGRVNEIKMGKITTTQFAGLLAAYTDQPVVDKTELTGLYDFQLKWVPGLGVDAVAADPDGVSLFTAIQEQLGLRLESSKGPTEVMVIDSADKPSEN